VRALAAVGCCVAALAALPAAAPAKAGWGAPQTVSRTSTTDPVTAIDPRGNAFVMWTRQLVGGLSDRHVEFAVRPRGGRFRTPEVPPSQADGDKNGVALAVDSSGRLFAAWSAGVRAVQLATRPPERRFEVTSERPAGLGHVALAARGTGEAIAAWHSSAGIELAVRARAAAGFGPSQTVSAPLPAGAVSGSPAVAVNAAGDAVVSWGVSGVSSGAQPGLYVSFRRRGGSFGAPRRISYPSGTPAGDTASNFAHHAALSAAGEALVTWESGQDDESTSHIWVAQGSPAGGFRTQALTSVGFGSTLAVDARGYAYVAFGMLEGSARFATRAPGHGFGRARAFGRGAELPRLATDADGTLHAVWRVGGRMLAARKPRGRIFERSRVISGSSRSARDTPSLSVNARGEAVAAWESFAGSGGGPLPYKVRAALFRPR
jgi:hypothetical protein